MTLFCAWVAIRPDSASMEPRVVTGVDNGVLRSKPCLRIDAAGSRQ